MAIPHGARVLSVLGLIVSLQFAARAAGAERDDWTGHEFMPKATCQPKLLNRSLPLKALSLPFTVQKTSGDWLWVGHAWVRKSDVVSLFEAEQYYNEYLEAHPQSKWAGEFLLAASRARFAALCREPSDELDSGSEELNALLKEGDSLLKKPNSDGNGLTSLLSAPVLAEPGDGAIGQEVMPKAFCVPKVQDRLIPLKELPLPFTVQKVNGDWLWVGRAWVRRWEVVTLDDAEEFYDEYLDRHPQSRWAGECLLTASKARSAALDRHAKMEVDAIMETIRQKVDAEMREKYPDWKGPDAVAAKFDSPPEENSIPWMADEWIGQEVMPKAFCVPKVQDRLIPLKELPLPFTVQRVNGDWLWIGRAWVKKWEVVSVDRASLYYMAYAGRHSESQWARDCEAIAWRAQEAAWEREKVASERQHREIDDLIKEPKDNVVEVLDFAKDCELVVVPVTLAGQVYQFVVDTGCTACVVDTSLRPLVRETGESKRLNGGKAFDVYRLPELKVGRLQIPPDARTICHDLSWFRFALGQDVRGILGMNVLKPHILRMDFDARKLFFLKRRPENADAEFPLAYSAGIPMIETNLLTDKLGWFRIDSGMNTAATIQTRTFDELLKNGRLARLGLTWLLKLGSFEIHRQASLRRPGAGESPEKSLRFGTGTENTLGLGFLSAYDVTFDFPRDRLYLNRGKRLAESLHAEGAAVPAEFEELISAHKESVDRVPQDAAGYVSRARVWFGAGQPDKAIADCDEALRLDSSCASAYSFRGSAWGAKGDYDKALSDFGECIRLDPQSPLGHYNRGVIFYYRAEYDKAVADLNEAIRLAPFDVDARKSLAWLCATCPREQYRDGKRAVALATEACDLSDWQDRETIVALAAAYAESADFENAVKFEVRALDVAGGRGAKRYRSRLELYKSGKAYREDK